MALYPSFKDDASLNKLTENGNTVAALFGATGSLTSPTGWLNANLYANFVPLIVLLLAIGYGSASIAGQDEDGTLGLVATLPLSRRRLVAEKFATMCLQASAGRTGDDAVRARRPRLRTAHRHRQPDRHHARACCCSRSTSARWPCSSARPPAAEAAALGISSALAAASYIINSLAPVVHWIHPLRFASPFFYAVGDGQLVRGLSAGGAAVLIGIAVVLVIASTQAFERLDIH